MRSCVWKGSVRNDGLPRTRLGRRGQKTPSTSGGFEVSGTRVQPSPSIHPVQSSVEAAQLVQKRRFKAESLWRGSAFQRASIRRVALHEIVGLRGALVIGDPSLVAELSQLSVRDCVHGGEFGEVRVLQGRSRREEASCEIRASRTCEASHPGPRSGARGSLQRRRSRSLLDALQFDLTQYDSSSNCQGNGRQSATGQSQVLTVPACSNEVEWHMQECTVRRR